MLPVGQGFLIKDGGQMTISTSSPNTSRRWTVLLGGFLLSLMGGMSYAWGSFVVPLVMEWGWTATQATLPFTIMIIVFSITMIPAGWIQDRIGPRKVATWGALLFFVGYALSGLLRWIPDPLWLVFSYGILVGGACGLTYACIAPTARKWYGDRPGFAVSTAVMGFGLAAVVFSPLKRQMINLCGVDGTFVVLSIFIAVVALIGARLLKNPPGGYRSPPRKEAVKSKGVQSAELLKDIPPKEFIKTKVFYILWLALAMVIGGGLTAIGLIPAYGEIVLSLEPAIAATAISAYALTNGLGRPFVGALSDQYGTLRVMITVYIMQATVFLALPFIAVNFGLLLVCSLLLGVGYATTFALFPVLVASGFGTKYLGFNYGLVFSAFGIGALTSLLGSRLLDITNSFTPAFLLAGSTTVLGLVLLLMFRREIEG
ncbi:OFA family MFS transporter [Isachenkonia alkalipeptolytica]|uniref:OFA family MFS transporter n=2 Tax=Isachenkonia alkalipeptolytica TaxID=2565777 RepID=A0AA43XKN9_9CLOT|nr:OFA family MFS transporter [Isachenkonia alkalipeptolytica]